MSEKRRGETGKNYPPKLIKRARSEEQAATYSEQSVGMAKLERGKKRLKWRVKELVRGVDDRRFC